MTRVSRYLPAAALCTLALLAGCNLPGKPGPGSTPQRPEDVTNFKTLYGSNCAACHGKEGRDGMAVSLANPAYLAYAGEDNIAAVTGKGIGGSLMPAFAKSSGGLLTQDQVNIIAHGIVSSWGNPQALHGATPPPYHSTAIGQPAHGEQLYANDCLRCHADTRGSLLDPTYLALISPGGLRTVMVSGKPTRGMPDWQGYPSGPLTDQDLADLVAFLETHRAPNPGQPFANRQGAFPAAQPQAQPANPLAPTKKEQQR